MTSSLSTLLKSVSLPCLSSEPWAPFYQQSCDDKLPEVSSSLIMISVTKYVTGNLIMNRVIHAMISVKIWRCAALNKINKSKWNQILSLFHLYTIGSISGIGFNGVATKVATVHTEGEGAREIAQDKGYMERAGQGASLFVGYYVKVIFMQWIWDGIIIGNKGQRAKVRGN